MTSQAAATIQLMHQLSLTAASLSRFQQVAFPEHDSSVVPSTTSTKDITNHRSESSHSSVHLNGAISPTLSQSEATNEDSPPTSSQRGDVAEGISRSVSPECCGGILDCRDLIEPEPTTSSLTRMSGLRSTSSPGFGYNTEPYQCAVSKRM